MPRLLSAPSSVYASWRPVVERRVGPVSVVEGHPPADAGPGLGAGGELGQVDALVLERSPQPLDKHIVHPSALAVHRDTNARRLEHVGEIDAGKLAALVAIEDLRSAIAHERLVQHLRRPAAGRSWSRTAGRVSSRSHSSRCIARTSLSGRGRGGVIGCAAPAARRSTRVSPPRRAQAHQGPRQ